MRLVSYDSGGRPAARASCSARRSCRCRRSALRSVRELLAELDADGLRALGERAGAAGERLALGGVQLARAGARPAEDHLHRAQLPRPRGRDRPGDPAGADVVREVRELADRAAARTIVLPAAHPDYVDYEAELALVIGRRGARGLRGRRARPHRRRDAVQRRQRARPADPEPAVDERQGDRQLRAVRAGARDARRGRRPRRAGAAHAHRRRDACRRAAPRT